MGATLVVIDNLVDSGYPTSISVKVLPQVLEVSGNPVHPGNVNTIEDPTGITLSYLNV